MSEDANRRRIAESKVAHLEEEALQSRCHTNELEAHVNRMVQENEARASRMQDSHKSHATPAPNVQTTRSKRFAKLPAVVDDSQARDPGEIMGQEDPFMGAENSVENDQELARLFSCESSPPQRTTLETTSSMSHNQTYSRRSHTTVQNKLSRLDRDASQKPVLKTGFVSSSSQRESQDSLLGQVPEIKMTDTQEGVPGRVFIAGTTAESSQEMLDASQSMRKTKRDAAAAGIGTQNADALKRSRQDSQVAALGPTVGNSQSPGHMRKGQRRKVSSTQTGRKSQKGWSMTYCSNSD